MTREDDPDYYPIHPCMRSGFCCKQATCSAGVIHGAETTGCKFLRGSRPGEYSCGLVDDGIISPNTLHIGAGCCSPLFNEDRVEAKLHRAQEETRAKAESEAEATKP